MSEQPRHWAQMVAELFAPSREQLIESRLRQIEETPDVEIVELIRQAKGEPPLPPLAEQIEAERIRLEAMTTDAILAERLAEDRELAEMIEQARQIAAEQEQRLRAMAPEWFDGE